MYSKSIGEMEHSGARQGDFVCSESTKLLDEEIRQEHNRTRRGRKQASTGRKLAVLVACTIQLVVVTGIGYGLGVMYAELVIVFNAKRADAVWVQSLYNGLFCTGGILFTVFINRFGPGRSIIVGSLIGAVGLFASAFASGLPGIIVCTGVVSGLATSILFLLAYTTTGLVFQNSASFYLICLTLGISIGQFLVPLLFELFISLYSWSGAFIIIAGVSLHCVPCGLVIYYSEPHFETRREAARTNVLCDGSLLKDFVMWILLVNFALYAMTGNIEAWFMVDHVVSGGFTRESGSLLVSMVGVGSFFGRIIGVGLRIACKFSTVNHWIYLYLLIGASHLVIINLGTFWSLFATCLVHGALFATSASQVPAIMFEVTGPERFPQGTAYLNIMVGIGDVVGLLSGGFIKDCFGTYNVLFYISAGTSVYISLSTVIISLVLRGREKHKVIK